ncbi:MAG TPA: amidohydrolase family protein [Ktedonobacteraceae bacterium]|nr:amidohydrolase family protein [Ktedonobacteraceae bacterium]
MKSLLFRQVTVIDGTGSAPRPNMDVLVSDGRIHALEAHGSLVFDKRQMEVYHLPGMTLLPGLIDCHVHIMMDGGPEGRVKPEESLGFCLLRAAYHARRTLEAGITTVRDLGGQAHLEFALREAIAAGYCSGPRLVLAGKLLSMTSAGAEAFAGMYREADGVDEVRKAAREQLKAGANVIKVMATGAVMTPGEEPGASQYALDEMRAAAEEAHKVGRKMAAHAHGSAGILTAVQAGADTIEHGSLLCDSPEAIRLMAERGVFLVPTLAAGIMSQHAQDIPAFMAEKDQRLLEAHHRSVRMALEAGVPIAMGTDAGVPFVKHGDNAIELPLMVNAGLTPMQAIVASTSNAARALGLQHEIGTIEVGKRADLLILDGDPLQDIETVTRKECIRMVVQDGNIVVLRM